MADSSDLAVRLDALAELLPILAQALDVRDVFPHILRVTRKVLPHDTVGVALIADDGHTVRIHALSSDVGFTPPEEFPVTAEGRALLTQPWDYLLVDDMQHDPMMRVLAPVASGLRSSLRVPIRRDGRLVGGVNFMSEQVAAFGEQDIPVAQRVAAYIDLALSHQRLAEAAARAAEARERAQVLQRRVDVLQEELVALGRLPRRIVGDAPAWRRVMADAAKVAPTETTVLLTGASGSGRRSSASSPACWSRPPARWSATRATRSGWCLSGSPCTRTCRSTRTSRCEPASTACLARWNAHERPTCSSASAWRRFGEGSQVRCRAA